MKTKTEMMRLLRLGLISFLLVLLVLIPLASALDDNDKIPNQGPAMHGECTDLAQACGNCTFVNITSISNPVNGSNDLSEQVVMTQTSGTDYIYGYCFPPNIFGEYIIRGKGDPDGTVTPFGFRLNVTPTGDDRQFSLMLIITIIGAVLAIGSIPVNFKPAGFVGGLLLGIAGVYTMIYGFNNINDLYTQATAGVVLVMGFFFVLISGWQMAEEFFE